MLSELRDPPLARNQFRLRTAFVLLTVAGLLLSVVRHLPVPENLTISAALQTIAVVLLLTFGLYLTVAGANIDSPLFGGWIGTIVGGAVFGVLFLGIYIGNEPKLLVILVIASIVGALVALAFSMVGLAVVCVVFLFVRRDGLWSGIVCGAVAGYTSLLLLGVGTGNDGAGNRAEWWAATYPAIVGGLYGGLGAAMRRKTVRRVISWQELNAIGDPSRRSG